MADNTTARIIENVTGKHCGTITAEEASKKAPPLGCSYRCNGKCVDPITHKRSRCNAEVTPYSVSKRTPDGHLVTCYYFREYQDHDDGLGDSLTGKGGLHKGHVPFCEFGDPGATKISKEYLEDYEVEKGTMADAIAWCKKKEPAKKGGGFGISGESGTGGGGKASKDSETIIRRTIARRSAKAKRVIEFFFHAMNHGGSEKVMSIYNYERIRSGELNGEGPHAYMAGTCPNYEDVATAVKNQHPELNKEKCTILSDPFWGTPVIYVLIDKLPSDWSWLKKSKRMIYVGSVKDFVFDSYMEVEEVAGDNTVRKKVFMHEHGPYFAVMCDWVKLPLTVNGEKRVAFVGEIYALGAQIEFFQPNDLMGAKEKLRYWEKRATKTR